MKTSQSFQFYPTDFLLGTALMSAAEVGAYIRLLCYQWQEGSLPNDTKLLARLASCNVEEISPILEKFRLHADGKLRNQKLESVRKSLNAWKLSRIENGKKGGRPRKLVVSGRFDESKATESSPSPSPSPSPIPSTETEAMSDGHSRGELFVIPSSKPNKAKGTLQECKEYAKERGLDESDGEWFFDKCEGSGWKNGDARIVDWKATIRAWQRIEIMPSQKQVFSGRRNGNAHEQPTGI